MRLTFGVFIQILRLCKIQNVPDTQLMGTITRTVDPTCGYIDKSNKDTVSAIIRCERNLSPGNIEESGSGATRKPSESISNVVEAAQKANRDEVVRKFATEVVCLLTENRKTAAVLALLDVIKNDETLDDDGFDGEKLSFNKYMRTTKSALLTQSDFVLSDFLAGVFLYTAAAGVMNTIGKATVRKINSPYISRLVSDRVIVIYDSKESAAPINPIFSLMRLRDKKVQPKEQPAFYNYLQHISESNDRIKTLLYTDEPKPFYDFYVCNDIVRRFYYGRDTIPPEIDQMLLRDMPRNPRSVIKDADIQKLSEISRFLIVAGTGGLGKSMLMRHLLLSTIRNYKQFPLVPVFLMLKDYDGSIPNLLELSYNKIKAVDENITKDNYITALKEGSCLVLLDGLDEVGAQNAATFEQELEKFTIAYPDNCYVISSRPFQNFVSFRLFSVLRMLPFDKEQALKLIDKLDYRPDNPAIKEKFREALDKQLCDTHRSFIENPLLLSIMLMTFARFAEVPSKMHIFYKEAFDALSSTHDASKGAYKRSLRTGLMVDKFAEYFAEICFRTYCNEKYEFTEEEFDQVFRALSINDGAVKPEDFLYDLCYCMCLIYLDGNKYYFQHRSFQEYFSAVFLSKQKDTVISHLGDFFENHARRMAGDNTFNMLYDMIPDKIDSFVIIPFLEAMLERYKKADGYLSFLSEMYPRIQYAVGEHDILSGYVSRPRSFIYGSVVVKMLNTRKCNFDLYDTYQGLPECSDFLSMEYVKVKIEDRYEIMPKGVLKEMNASRKQKTEIEYSDDVVGKAYIVDTREVLRNPEKYAELIEAFEGEGFVHKIEYQKMQEYLAELKAKQQSTDDALLGLL